MRLCMVMKKPANLRGFIVFIDFGMQPTGICMFRDMRENTAV